MHKLTVLVLSLLTSMVRSISTKTLYLHGPGTTTITQLPPAPSISTIVVVTHVSSTTTITLSRPTSTPLPTALTTTVTTRIQSTTTTTTTMYFSPFAAPSSSTILTLDGSASNALQTSQNSSCTCLAPGAWCGTRSAMQVAINGTCNWNSLYMCKSNVDQTPQEFNCTEFLQPIFGSGAVAGCMEGNAGLNDDCIMPKNGTS